MYDIDLLTHKNDPAGTDAICYEDFANTISRLAVTERELTVGERQQKEELEGREKGSPGAVERRGGISAPERVRSPANIKPVSKAQLAKEARESKQKEGQKEVRGRFDVNERWQTFQNKWEARHGNAGRKEMVIDSQRQPPGPTWSSAPGVKVRRRDGGGETGGGGDRGRGEERTRKGREPALSCSV
jgi:hypothetical protein